MIIKLIINNKTNLAMKKYQGGAIVSQIYESPSLTEHSILAEAGFANSGNIGELPAEPMSMSRYYYPDEN